MKIIETIIESVGGDATLNEWRRARGLDPLVAA